MKRCLLLAVLLSLYGCASVPAPTLSPDIRATLGTIGVMAWDTPFELDYPTPTTGAASGAWGGLKVWGRHCRESGKGCGPILWVLSPFYVIGGALYGAVAGESAEAVASADSNLREAWAGMKVQEWIRDLVFQHARERTRYTVRLLSAPGPLEHDAASGRAALAEQGVTTVLELRVPKVALVVEHIGHNPPMFLLVTADATLTRTHDGAVLYALSLERKTSSLPFLAWGANSAREFRYQLAMLAASLVNEIWRSVFLPDLPPPRGSPRSPDPTSENEAAKPEDSGEDHSKPQD